jgi:mannose-6-phosphate isomerase-like protein (cupin superfamily)|tara:strand:- start:1928 stop:2359 length:432 start_codon:yes stop_codon:yes gene_type:complete
VLASIIHPEQLQGFRFSDNDHCRLALLNAPDDCHAQALGDLSMFVEIHDPCDRVPPHSHQGAAELYFVLRGRAIFHVDDNAICAGTGDFIQVPAAARHDFENPGPNRLYLLTVLSHDMGFAELLRNGVPTPLDAEDLEVLRSL